MCTCNCDILLLIKKNSKLTTYFSSSTDILFVIQTSHIFLSLNVAFLEDKIDVFDPDHSLLVSLSKVLPFLSALKIIIVFTSILSRLPNHLNLFTFIFYATLNAMRMFPTVRVYPHILHRAFTPLFRQCPRFTHIHY